MKFLYMVGSLLRSKLKNNKVILLLFFFGIFSSVLVFIYFYGNFSFTNGFVLRNSEMFRTYTIELGGDPESDRNSINQLESRSFESVVYFTTQAVTEDSSLESLNDVIAIGTRRDDDYKLSSYAGRYNFTDFEIENGENVIILHHGASFKEEIASHMLDEKVLIGDIEYTVIGIHFYDTYPVIPFSTFVANSLPVSHLNITVPELLSFSEAASFKEELLADMPGVSVTTPYEKYYRYVEENDRDHWILLICVFAVSLLVFMFLMKYLLDSSRYEYVVYSISGATKARVIFLMAAETFILILLSSLSAVIIHRLFYSSFFERLNAFNGLRYGFSDYASILIMICLCALVCMIPFMVSYIHKGLVFSKNKYK